MSSDDKSTTGWAYVINQQLRDLAPVDDSRTYTLHSITSSDGDSLPIARAAVKDFWNNNEIGYGSAATVSQGDWTYLYGVTPSNQTALARIKTASDFKSRSSYSFYVSGQWTATAPKRGDASISLANTYAAQGTIYWSASWSKYVWLGGSPGRWPNSEIWVSTSLAPEGPWSEATKIYDAQDIGNSGIPAYSMVAHPELKDDSVTGDYIFVVRTSSARLTSQSWTKEFTDDAPYQQPLARIDWK